MEFIIGPPPAEAKERYPAATTTRSPRGNSGLKPPRPGKQIPCPVRAYWNEAGLGVPTEAALRFRDHPTPVVFMRLTEVAISNSRGRALSLLLNAGRPGRGTMT